MPILTNQKTVWVDSQPWSSPDGKVTIWTIKLEGADGTSVYQTMSKAIAEVGWSGDIELYTNAKGKDYVRQAKKEDAPAAFGSKGADSQQYLKDLSDTPLRVFSSSIGYFDTQGLLKDAKYYQLFLTFIERTSTALIGMSETIRTGERKTSQSATSQAVDTVYDPADDPSALDWMKQNGELL